MIRLIKVEAGENNNKYYNMEKNADGSTFNANYGRVGSSRGQNKTYPMSDWDRIYKQKTAKKKGYVDISDMVSAGPSKSGMDAGSAQPIVDFLMGSANSSISDNYLVGADTVTQAQVDTAQDHLNEIAKIIRARKASAMTIDGVNSNLKALYTTIPRKMGKVIDHMANTVKSATELLTLEQANLDVMSGQVVSIKADGSQKSLSDTHIDIQTIPANEIKGFIDPRLDYLKSNFKKAWRVENKRTQKVYDEHVSKQATYSKQMLLWHGSRNENWWSIINQGLLVRPTNAVHTGSMFGDGLYFADYDRKSYGYTSGRGSYWASGSSNKAILALYDVHIGNPLTVRQHDYWMSSLSTDKLKSKGSYDSVFAEKGVSLMNNEYIVYKSQQCTIKYLIEVGS